MPKSSTKAETANRQTATTHSPGGQKPRRTFLLALIGLGAFIVGRSTQLKWNEGDYLKGIDLLGIAAADLLGPTNATDYSRQRGAHAVHQQPLLRDAPYYINDKTMRLSPYVDHLWLHNGESNNNKPKVKLVLTSFGWNHPDREKGLQFPRSLRMREMMQAVIDHPLFDPTFSWSDMVSGKATFDPSIQYFAFMDVETCFESNYPNYVGDLAPNSDRAGNRNVKKAHECPCFDINGCPQIQKVLNSPLFKQLPTARLIFFECRGFGPSPSFRGGQTSPQLSIVSISSEPSQLLPASDMGHPPPAINPARLSPEVRKEIMETCDQETPSRRPYFLSCVGAVRNQIRRNLFKLHNETAGIILMQTPHFQERFGTSVSYQQVMRESLFAATPRGDNRFSYRFTEVLSTGAIPVIHSDGWVLPFRRELIDWARDCAIVIPESQVEETIDILRSVTPEERCRRRRRCYEIYTQYMANPEGTLAGVIESATRAIQSASATT